MTGPTISCINILTFSVRIIICHIFSSHDKCFQMKHLIATGIIFLNVKKSKHIYLVLFYSFLSLFFLLHSLRIASIYLFVFDRLSVLKPNIINRMIRPGATYSDIFNELLLLQVIRTTPLISF